MRISDWSSDVCSSDLKLAADDRVGHVLTRGTTVGPALADSVPLIGAPGRWADGYTGDGKVVVVVDTGIDADFGGTLIGGACFAGSQSASGTVAGHCGPAGDQLRAFDGLCFRLGLCTDRSSFDAAEIGRANV